MGDMPKWVIEQLLTKGASPWQFELFCARHFSRVENVQYVITSRNYDAGRDVRTEFPSRDHGSSYIIASLQQDRFEEKALRDLSQLLKRDPRPAKVRCCFTADATEMLRDRIIAGARRLHRSSFYEVSGRTQLLDSIERFPQVFEADFENEIDQFRRFVRRDPQGTESAIGLRVVLGTQLSGTAEELRMHVLGGLVLRSIPSIGKITLPALCCQVSAVLRLDSPVHESYLRAAVESLAKDGLITVGAAGIERRRKADAAIDKANLQAALNAVDGYSSLKQGLERFLNEPIPKIVMRSVWQVVRHGTIRLFHEHGLQVVRSVYRLSEDLPPEIGESISDDLLRELTAIAGDISAAADDEEQESFYRRISTCFTSVMLEVGSEARRWFSELSLVYITACSLALHPDAVKQIEQRVRSWRVIPDTHFVLSLLGCSEPDHFSIRQLTVAWTRLGGVFIAAPPLISEAYRHACKAQDSFQRWAQHYRRHERRAARRGSALLLPDKNVFLRSAQCHFGDGLTLTAVEAFIQQFGTREDGDARRIQTILEEDYKFFLLPGRDTRGKLRDAFFTDLLQMRQSRDESDEHNVKDRCNTDADLLVYLSELRRAPDARGKVTVVLSNSGHMKRVCSQYPAAFGVEAPIVNVARVAFALSLQPGTAMTVKSLESMFFGGDFAGLVRTQKTRAVAVLSEYATNDGRGLYPSSLRDRLDREVFNEKPSGKRTRRAAWQ